MHKPFMGVSDSSGDGPIFVDTLSASGDGQMVENFGNSDMKNFKTGSSAMDIVNSPSVKSDFNLGSGPTSTTSHAPSPIPVSSHRSSRMGDINMRSGEFWGVAGLAFTAGVLGKYLFDRYYK